MFTSVQRSLRRSFPPHFALYGATAVAWGASGAVLALGAPACSDKATDTNNGDTFDGGSAQGSATDTATSDCTTCAVQECAGAWAVCLTDSRCAALRSCDEASGESQAAYAAFAACTDARTCGTCAMECTSICTAGAPNKPRATASCAAASDASDAGDAGDRAHASVDACASCVADKCGDAKKLCALGTECSAFLGCAYACADTSCVDGCGTAHSTGKASANELSSCTLTSCRSACGL